MSDNDNGEKRKEKYYEYGEWDDKGFEKFDRYATRTTAHPTTQKLHSSCIVLAIVVIAAVITLCGILYIAGGL